MNLIVLSSRPTTGSLKASTLFLVHRGSPKYWILKFVKGGDIFKPPYQSGGRAYYIHHYTRPTVACIYVLFGGIQNNILHKRVFIWCSISVKILIYKEWMLLYVAFCTIMVLSRPKETRSREYALPLFRMTLRIIYSAQYHRQHCTLQAF